MLKLDVNRILDQRQLVKLRLAMINGLDSVANYLRAEFNGTEKFVYRGGHHVCLTPKNGNPDHLVCVIEVD